MIIILVSVKFEILTAEHLRVRQLVSKILEVSLFDIALLQYFGIGLLRKDLFLPISLVTFAVCRTFGIYPRQPGQPTKHGLWPRVQVLVQLRHCGPTGENRGRPKTLPGHAGSSGPRTLSASLWRSRGISGHLIDSIQKVVSFLSANLWRSRDIRTLGVSYDDQFLL